MVEITNSILIAPKLAKDIALGRQPPLRKGCADEFMETVSYMVQGGDIVIDPNTREIITSAGLTLEQLLETKVKPHWLEPAAARSLELETWQAGNLSMQGELYNHFLEQCGGNRRAAQVMLEDSAIKHGTKAGSLSPGRAPGEKTADDARDDAKSLATNPWSDKFRGTEEQRQERIASICRTSTKLANSLAAKAGVQLNFKPLRK